MKRTKPRLSFTDQAKRDLESCRLFLRRTPRGLPERRIAEIRRAARYIRDSPKLYPVEDVHPTSGLEFRRKNAGQFAIIYAYIEPAPRAPRGLISIRAIRHAAKEDVLFRVEEDRAIGGHRFSPLRTGQTTSLPLGNESEIDDALRARIELDWAEIMAAVDSDDPDELRGGVVFNSEDYATEEEEEAAWQAFVTRLCGGPDDEAEAGTPSGGVPGAGSFTD